MDLIWALFAGVVIVVACLLAAVFIVGTYNVVIDAWAEWSRRRQGEKIDGPLAEDPFWFAVTATLFMVILYVLIVTAFVVIVL